MANETPTNFNFGDIFEGASIFNPSTKIYFNASSERESTSELSQDIESVKFDWESQSFIDLKNEMTPNKPKNYNYTAELESQKYLDSQQSTGQYQPTGSSIVQPEKRTSEQKEAEKKKVKNDIYTLTGSIEVNPVSPVCGVLKTGCTVAVNGVGNALTGKYLIKNKEVGISSSGATCNIEVIKTGFEGTDLNGGKSK